MDKSTIAFITVTVILVLAVVLWVAKELTIFIADHTKNQKIKKEASLLEIEIEKLETHLKQKLESFAPALEVAVDEITKNAIKAKAENSIKDEKQSLNDKKLQLDNLKQVIRTKGI